MLLFKGSSGHVETSFDKTAKNFPVKLQVFLVKVQEKQKTNFSRVFFDVFHSVHLITVSTRLNIFLPKSEKTSLKNPKRHDDSINYFYHFFLKVLLRTRGRHF